MHKRDLMWHSKGRSNKWSSADFIELPSGSQFIFIEITADTIHRICQPPTTYHASEEGGHQVYLVTAKNAKQAEAKLAELHHAWLQEFTGHGSFLIVVLHPEEIEMLLDPDLNRWLLAAEVLPDSNRIEILIKRKE